MPSARYRCGECGAIHDYVGSTLPVTFSERCAFCHGAVREFQRVWDPPAIGRVAGAGGSPSRPSGVH